MNHIRMWAGTAIKEHFCCRESWQWSCSKILSQANTRGGLCEWCVCVSVLRDTRWSQLWHRTCRLILRRCMPSTCCTLQRRPGKPESPTSRGRQTLFKGEKKKREIFWLSVQFQRHWMAKSGIAGWSLHHLRRLTCVTRWTEGCHPALLVRRDVQTGVCQADGADVTI